MSDSAPLLPAFAHWPLDDGTGLTAQDTSGNNHPLSLVGAAWTGGMFGNGVSSDGVDDYLVAPSLDLSGTSAVTVSIWASRTYVATSGHTLVELSTDANFTATGFGIYPDDTFTCTSGPAIMLFVRGDVGYSGRCFPQPSPSAWHHLVAVFDKSQPGTQETVLYIDGIEQTPIMNTGTSDNTNNFGVQPLYLLSRAGAGEFNSGTIDEITLFDRALTPAEIAAL